MRDVSRVEYDAALKRVREAYWKPDGRGTVVRLTLAALGLDGPPTEACSCTADADDPDAATERCPKSERACGHHCAHSWSHDRCCWCGMEWDESGEVVPPAEPPKACPTSDEPLGTCAIHGNYWTDDCLRCGSGIDGGTA